MSTSKHPASGSSPPAAPPGGAEIQPATSAAEVPPEAHRTGILDSRLISSRSTTSATDPAATDDHAAAPFRPIHRPPVGILQILDDDQASAEVVRIRAERTVLGRAGADVVIPHDSLVSSRHAEITRHSEGGTYTWQLTDVGSTNGTFIKAAQAKLKDGEIFMAGGHLFRFEESGSDSSGPRQASLVMMTAPDGPKTVPLERSEFWIGRDPALGAGALPDDPTLDRKHVLLHRGPKAQWLAKDINSVNGLWIRVKQTALKNGCTFQLGEQRFNFFVL